MSSRRRGASAVALLLMAAAPWAASCARHEPAEVHRFVTAEVGEPAPVYTLGDETRPVLALPPETRLQLTLPAEPGETFAFTVPATLEADTLVVSGSFQRAKRAYPLAPQRATVAPGPAGTRQASIVLPALARGPGPPSVLSLVLTAPPDGRVVVTRTPPVTLPRGARLHFAYGLNEAAGLADAAVVTFEVATAAAARAETDGPPLWSATLRPATFDAHRWHEATIELDALAGRELAFVFRAEAAAEGAPLVLPLWADPTLVAPARRPRAQRNVVLISLDTLRADRIGAYGAYRPTTPALDALAAESVVFTNAWAPWPETSGSHMSLFTSRYPSEHGVTSFITAPPPTIELLAERLRQEGYLTRAFTENGGVWAHAGFARGFSAYAEQRSPDFVYRGEAATTFARATRWVESHAARPFFLFVHTYQVHAPYVPPAGYRDLFTDIPGREPPDFAASALAYDRETRFTDDQVGPFLATLRGLGLAERSIVIVTSDHGEEFGEHGGKGHGHSLHREVLHVPLIVWAPGLLAPARVAAPASLLDVAPTLLDLLALAGDPGHRGISLVPAARGDTTLAERPIFAEVDRVERQPIRFVAVRHDGRTAITDLSDHTTRCYAADDPGEQRPRTECPDLAALITTHRAAMVPLGARPVGESDPRLIEKMRALGYIE